MRFSNFARTASALALAAALAAAGGCAGSSPRGAPPGQLPDSSAVPAVGHEIRRAAVARVDLARVGFLTGYGLLMEGWPDSALAQFQRSLARAEAEHTPDSGGRWGLALAYRLSGRVAQSDTLLLALKPSSEPEALLARGWFDETVADTLSALRTYAQARRADSTWTPPYLREARLVAARGDVGRARELLDQAAALGDTLVPTWRAALVPPPPPTPAESLLAAAEASPALTRLQLAALLRRHGCPVRPPRVADPALTHFRAVRDSFQDLAGSPWVGLARDAVVVGRMEVFPDGSFRGAEVVSRGRFALWLDQFEWPAAAALPAEGAERETAGPRDVPISDYRRGAVERVTAAGLMRPRGPGRFEPDAPVTGMEAAAAVGRAAEVR